LSKWLEHAARKTGKPNLVLAMISMLYPAVQRFKRMQAAWLALASEQDWLDGEATPTAEYENV
jgi:hypothetical protein